MKKVKKKTFKTKVWSHEFIPARRDLKRMAIANYSTIGVLNRACHSQGNYHGCDYQDCKVSLRSFRPVQFRLGDRNNYKEESENQYEQTPYQFCGSLWKQWCIKFFVC